MKAIFETLRHAALTRPEAPAFRDDIEGIGWTELATRVTTLATE